MEFWFHLWLEDYIYRYTIHLSTYICIFLTIYLYIYIHIWDECIQVKDRTMEFWFYLILSIFIYPSIYISSCIHLSIYLTIHLSVYPSIYLSIKCKLAFCKDTLFWKKKDWNRHCLLYRCEVQRWSTLVLFLQWGRVCYTRLNQKLWPTVSFFEWV